MNIATVARNAYSVPMVISPRETRYAAPISTTPLWPTHSMSDTGQYHDITWMTRYQRLRYSALGLAKRFRSWSWRAKARTTRMPVRFSWSMAVMRPSASSADWNLDRIFTKKITVKITSGGISTIDSSAIRESSMNSRGTAMPTRMIAPPISTRWLARNIRRVSTSEVHRWTRSPVSVRSW